MKTIGYCKYLVLLAVAMIIIAVRPIDAHADNNPVLYVGGVAVTGTGDITGEGITKGTPTYNATTHTLDLNGATITGVYTNGYSRTYNIYSSGITELTITGSGTLSGAQYGIYTAGCRNLTVNGTGSGIEVTSQSFGIDTDPLASLGDGNWQYNDSLTLEGKVTAAGTSGCGIYAYHDITINNGATIIANGTFAGIATYLPYKNAAADSSYRRQNIGTLTINGGTITAQGTYYGIFSAYTMEINGGTITATSTTSESNSLRFSGIGTDYGALEINNGITKIEATGAESAIEGGKSLLYVADGIRLSTPSNGNKNGARFYNSDDTVATHVVLTPLTGATIPFSLCGAIIYHDNNPMSQWGRTYTGSVLVPNVTVKVVIQGEAEWLDEGTYTLSYTDSDGNVVEKPTDIGTYYTVVTGKGAYAGNEKRNFVIGYRDMQYVSADEIEVVMPASSYTYTGKSIKPVPTLVRVKGITLEKGIDYEIYYWDSVEVGTARWRINAIRNFRYKVAEGTYEIVAADINNNEEDNNNASNNSSSENNSSDNASSGSSNTDNNNPSQGNSSGSSQDAEVNNDTSNNESPKDSATTQEDTAPEDNDDDSKEEKSAISLNTNSVVVQKGKTLKTIKVTLTNDEIASVKSSNTKIATVSYKGYALSIKGIKKGKTRITIETESGLSAKLSVEVQDEKVVTEKLKVSKSSITLKKKGKKATVTVTATPDYTSTKEKVTIKISDKKVATAKYDSSTGKITITAKKKGSCKITVKAGKKTATIKVKVKK